MTGIRPGLSGRWRPRGRFIRGVPDSEDRRALLDRDVSTAPFAWLATPVLNGLTRLALEASPATGELRAVGFEPTSRQMAEALPATERFEGRITTDGRLESARQAA